MVDYINIRIYIYVYVTISLNKIAIKVFALCAQVTKNTHSYKQRKLYTYMGILVHFALSVNK